MARKEKLTLDYFPHYAVQGDISKIIQERYGNDGYAVLYKNYEQFCLRDRQYMDLNEYVTLASISAYCKVSEEKYLEVVDTLVKLGAYDVELWKEQKILISEKFLENTKDAYRNRSSQNLNFLDLKDFLRKKSTSECISDVRNQQIKVKEIKGKENKELELEEEDKIVFFNSPLSESIEEHNFYGEYKNVGLTNHQRNKLLALTLSEEALSLLIADLGKNIEQGKEKPFICNLPNLHYERLASYWDYRKKHPEKFIETLKKNKNSFKKGVSNYAIEEALKKKGILNE